MLDPPPPHLTTSTQEPPLSVNANSADHKTRSSPDCEQKSLLFVPGALVACFLAGCGGPYAKLTNDSFFRATRGCQPPNTPYLWTVWSVQYNHPTTITRAALDPPSQSGSASCRSSSRHAMPEAPATSPGRLLLEGSDVARLVVLLHVRGDIDHNGLTVCHGSHRPLRRYGLRTGSDRIDMSFATSSAVASSDTTS